MSIAASWREGNSGRVDRGEERGEESEWDNTMRENARRALRDDTAGPLRERGDESGERGPRIEHGEKGESGGTQGEPGETVCD